MLVLTDSIIDWFKSTADHLEASVPRLFMAETVQQLGYGQVLRTSNTMLESFNFRQKKILPPVKQGKRKTALTIFF